MFKWKTAIMLDSGNFLFVLLLKLWFGENSGFRIFFFPEIWRPKSKEIYNYFCFPCSFGVFFLLEEPGQRFHFF